MIYIFSVTYFKIFWIIHATSFLLLFSFLLSLFFDFGLSRLLLLSKDLGIGLTWFVEDLAKALEFLGSCKPHAKLLDLDHFIRDVLGGIGPGVVAGLKLFESSEDFILLKGVVVNDAFVGGLGASQHSDHSWGLVLEEAEFALSSLFPLFIVEAVGLDLEFGDFLLLLLTGDLGPFGEIDDLPVSNDLLLDVLVTGVSLFFILLVFDGLLWFCGKHSWSIISIFEVKYYKYSNESWIHKLASTIVL